LYLKEFINELHLECDEVSRTDCPVCGGRNTFTASNKLGYVLYNCYKAGCTVKGSHRTRLTVDQVMNRMQTDKQVNQTEFVMPRYITRSDKVGLLADKWGIASDELLFDIKDNRVVFPVYRNNKLVDAVGRAISQSAIKWKRYNNSDSLFRKGFGSTAVIVEDAISASVVPTINTALAGVALMGTNMRDAFIDQLRSFESLIIALDPDARDKTIKITKKLRSVGFNTIALNLTDDIKYRRYDDVQALKLWGQ
jgi:hypothetical protein